MEFIVFVLIVIAIIMFVSRKHYGDDTSYYYDNPNGGESPRIMISAEKIHKSSIGRNNKNPLDLLRQYLPYLDENIFKEISTFIEKDSLNKIDISANSGLKFEGCKVCGKIVFVNGTEQICKKIDYSSVMGNKLFEYITFSRYSWNVREATEWEPGV